MNNSSSKRTKGKDTFDPKKSVQKAMTTRKKRTVWSLQFGSRRIKWASNAERIVQVRKGLPYDAIEAVSKRADMPIKNMLFLIDMPQTTYNKKKKSDNLLDKLESELILVLSEVLEFGLLVFNGEEEKFHRWLKKQNISLGGAAPETFFDSLTGIQEVRNALTRIEYGNLA